MKSCRCDGAQSFCNKAEETLNNRCRCLCIRESQNIYEVKVFSTIPVLCMLCGRDLVVLNQLLKAGEPHTHCPLKRRKLFTSFMLILSIFCRLRLRYCPELVSSTREVVGCSSRLGMIISASPEISTAESNISESNWTFRPLWQNHRRWNAVARYFEISGRFRHFGSTLALC